MEYAKPAHNICNPLRGSNKPVRLMMSLWTKSCLTRSLRHSACATDNNKKNWTLDHDRNKLFSKRKIESEEVLGFFGRGRHPCRHRSRRSKLLRLMWR